MANLCRKKEEAAMICNTRPVSGFLCFSLLLFSLCPLDVYPQSPNSLKSIDAPHGGKIIYGVVEGANTEAGALADVLRSVHNSYGERPLVGKVFRVRDTNSDALFFTVVNHPAGNKKVAGIPAAL
jgi:hypothetical protein